jgi:erythromycin esterase-like protein
MNENLIQTIKEYSKTFHNISDLEPIVNEAGNAKYALLGESSHGTSEYYKIRGEISKRLIIEKGFTFLAVEGDWPACQQVNRYIKGLDQKSTNARDVLKAFNRWPTWMWANEEMIDLIEWLKEYNQQQPQEKQVGFYGIDVYSLWESLDEIIKYLEKINSPDIDMAKKVFACFEPFNRQAEMYGVSTSIYKEGCRDEVIKLLTDICLKKHNYMDAEESSLNVEVNALITTNAENYYRTMVVDDNESWNIRDRHMVEVIQHINAFYNNEAKGIIWEHNTHVGDARATDMANEGLVNVGQLLREEEGRDNLFIVGFGTHRGSVIAAEEWGVNFERMVVPQAEAGSWEDAMHLAGPTDKLLIFNDQNKNLFSYVIGHRAIGVVYNPAYEHYGNYVPSSMSERYNAFIFIDESKALTPLSVERVYL